MAADLPQSPYGDKIGAPTAGIDDQRAAMMNSALTQDENKMPKGFPFHLWEKQQQRYRHNWKWFTGEYLSESAGKTRSGEPIYKFPLRINPIKNFSRKHAAMLLGEPSENNARLLIKPNVRVKNLTGDKPDEAKVEQGKYLQNLLNEVWTQSNANSIFTENATLSQFLGGSYITLNYEPWHTDLIIPIVAHSIKPDFVLPIWSPTEPFELLEAFIVYRVPEATAIEMWGYEPDGSRNGANMVTFCEHWTRTKHWVYLDGKPLTAKYKTADGSEYSVSYNGADNIFGFVPVFYKPRTREGNFYGNDIVADIEGLTLEYNGRLADSGTAMKRTAHRKWFGRNITQNPRQKMFDADTWYADLGMENPSVKSPPDIWPEDPPKWTEVFNNFNKDIWNQLLREGNMTKIALGEEEGSQRSAISLAIKFWPMVVIARMQRIFWSEALNIVNYRILHMIAILFKQGMLKPIAGLLKEFKLEDLKFFEITQDWLPMLPRDREQTVNEVVLLSQANRMSLERAIKVLGDVKDEDEEIERVWENLQRMLEMQTEQAQEIADGKAKADTSTQSPKADSGLGP